MKTKHLLVSLALGLGLALALLWYVGGRGEPVMAGSQVPVPDPQPSTETGQSPHAPVASLLIATNADYWPMEYISGTQFVGHDIDLMHALTAEMGVTAVFTDVPFAGILDRLAAGEYDAVIAALTVTPEREELIDFTLPYVKLGTDENLAIAVQQGNDAPRNQFNDALRKLRDDGTLQTIVAAIAADLPGSQARLPDWAHCWTRINDDPAGYDSVQAAVDAANEGDTVKVAGHCTGVHVRPRDDITTTGVVTQVVYVSKTITIRGGYTTTNWTTPDPEANPTTLDAQGQGRVLYITGDISPTIEGLRITGGDAAGLAGTPWDDAGGGVYVISATATISHCQVFSNVSGAFGGGLYLDCSGVTLSRNAIFANTAPWGGGLCLYCLYSSDSTTLSENSVTSNTAWYGGGLYARNSTATLNRNTFSDNDAEYDGGGLYLPNSSVTLNENIVTTNVADGNGGGLHLAISSYALTNNVVADNQASGAGGGLYMFGATSCLLHNTVARNGSSPGSAVYVTGDSTVALTNTVLVSHAVGISVTGGNTVTVNGVLWHNTPVTVSQSITAAVTVQNQHTGDPAFAADGYHITPASAAMDAGVDAGVTTDIDGHVRPYNAIPDLGADEIIATFVSTDTASSLVYTDTQGLATAVQVPAGAVTETVTLAYTPVEAASPPSGFAFAGRAFDLDAYQGETLLASFTFSQPVTITLHYDEADIGGVGEDTLVLRSWSAGEWVDAACGPYDRHPADDWLAVPICHLSRFALFGEQRKVYLPLVLSGAEGLVLRDD